jgi:hypothetical protein
VVVVVLARLAVLEEQVAQEVAVQEAQLMSMAHQEVLILVAAAVQREVIPLEPLIQAAQEALASSS